MYKLDLEVDDISALNFANYKGKIIRDTRGVYVIDDEGVRWRKVDDMSRIIHFKGGFPLLLDVYAEIVEPEDDPDNQPSLKEQVREVAGPKNNGHIARDMHDTVLLIGKLEQFKQAGYTIDDVIKLNEAGMI